MHVWRFGYCGLEWSYNAWGNNTCTCCLCLMFYFYIPCINDRLCCVSTRAYTDIEYLCIPCLCSLCTVEHNTYTINICCCLPITWFHTQKVSEYETPWIRQTMYDGPIYETIDVYTLNTCFARPIYSEKVIVGYLTSNQFKDMLIQIINKYTVLPAVINNIIVEYFTFLVYTPEINGF